MDGRDAESTSVTWAAPDGTLVPVPALAPSEALAAGWIRLSRGPADAWGLDVGDGPLTVAAVEAVKAEARRLGTPVPKGLSNRYMELGRSAWDAERDPTPRDAVARSAARIDRVRFIAAIDAAVRERGAHPDVDAFRAALTVARAACAPLYGLAHGWRSGPGPDLGPYLKDPSAIAEAIAANARDILAGARRLREAAYGMRLAARGIDRDDLSLPPPEGGARPGETPGDALRRLAEAMRAETEANVAARKADPGPRPSAAVEALYAGAWGFEMPVSTIERHAECALNGLASRAGDARALSNLGGWHLAHECGRTALDLRHPLERRLPDLLRAVGAEPRPEPALPACVPAR